MTREELLAFHRKEVALKENYSQKEIDHLVEIFSPHKEVLIPIEKAELLNITNSKGINTSITAPRWLFHLLGIKHKTIHLVLRLGSKYVFQIRSWSKFECPGQIDVSVGGHTTISDKDDSYKTVIIEMFEELGLKLEHFIDNKIQMLGSYDCFHISEQQNLIDNEWHDVYTANLTLKGFSEINFNDGEVSGLYLCNESELENLLNQDIIPIATGLKYTIPFLNNHIPTK